MVTITIGKVSGEFFVTLRLNLLVCKIIRPDYYRNVVWSFFCLKFKNEINKIKNKLCQNLTQQRQSQKL